MLIRSAQMAVFRKQFDERLPEYAFRFLREELTSDVEGLSDEVLQKRIELTLSRARSLGIDAGMALQIFLALTFGVGPHFDRHPVVKKIVHDSSLPILRDHRWYLPPSIFPTGQSRSGFSLF